MSRELAAPTPLGELRPALIANGQAADLHEVFAHPFTAGETIAQSKLGALVVDGRPASATVEAVLGNGDYVLRIRVAT